MEAQGPVVYGDVLFRASSYGVFLMPDGTHRSHYGIDLYASEGSEVRSPVAGVVDRIGLASDPGEIGGNSVRIRDATGEYHYAAHMLTPPLVRRGDRVDVGTPLGWVGKTGSARTTHPHTHYEWRDRFGRVKNPFAALVRAYALPADTRVARLSIAPPGGAVDCARLVGDATGWCDQARVALLEPKAELETIEDVPENPESTIGQRPVRWDIVGIGIAGVLTILIFGATTGGWFTRRARR